MKLITIDNTVVYGFNFTSQAMANSFACRCQKPHRVILGDHPRYWVVSPADAERLTTAGYEYAE